MRRALALLLLAGTVALSAAPDAGAAFTAKAMGSASAKATRVSVPPAPTVVSTGLFSILYCRVRVSWPAPPAGVTYTLRRSILGNSTTLGTALGATGILNDDIALTAVLGAPTYTLTASLPAPAVWTSAPSVSATATGCLSLV